MTQAGRYLSLVAGLILLALISSLPTGVSAQSTSTVLITEVHPGGSGNGTYAADWFEVTNTGASAVDVTGWKMDDSSNSFASGVALRGVTSIPAGKSAIFFEGTADGVTDPTIIANFSTAWFGSATPPAGTLIGAYGGSGVGLSTSGDAVVLFDAAGNSITGVRFDSAATGSPVATFDNTPGLGSASAPFPTIVTFSTAGVSGAFVAANGAEVGSPGKRLNVSPLSSVDLSTYVRVGRFDLPEPTRTTAPPNSVLAQEVSAVTYNWDTDTLFVVGDRGTSIVQVTKTGQLIDSMTLAPGGSPQGTDFYDPEGLTYVGGNMFVMVEERDRQAVLFSYAAGTTLTRANAKTVKLGTFVDNIGLEGITYDPLTGGFIAVKEISPQGIFQTGIDFDAGTATNGSASAENSTNLFDPALLNLLDFADVYALSNLSSLNGTDAGDLLVLSQESGKIVKVSRSGTISSTLTILLDPGNPLSVADHQHEGLTMDGNGNLYVVSENGGGDTDHPQLWVYAPASVPNQPPTNLVLSNQISSIAENVSTAARIKVADVAIVDDGLGVNALTVTGADAAAFEVDASGLYIKAGTVLDFETKANYSVTVVLDDATVGTTPDATASFSLTLTDTNEGGGGTVATIAITEVSPWSSGNSPYAADWFELTNTGGVAVDITGWRMDDDSNAFGNSVALNGVTSIAAGESVIFLEAAVLDTTKTTFLNTWFGNSVPAGLQVGSYSGSGVGLGTGGDALNIFDASGNRVTGVTFGTSTSGLTFDNTAALGSSTLPLPAVTTLSAVGVNGAFVAANAVETGSPGGVPPAVVLPSVVISEVSPWSSGNSPYAADWLELRNTGATAVNVAGWKVDDDSGTSANAVALSGVTSIAPGEAVIFIETADLATTKAAFLAAWFGANPPAGLQVGSYSGSGVGLGTGGDQVHLFDAAGNRITSVRFGSSTTGFTFDNAAGVGSSAAPPPPTIAALSVAGVNGAFISASGVETGSPGTVVPSFIVSEVSPWSSGNAPYEADWFEITNTGSVPVNVAGWKMDDNSGTFASSVALRGVTIVPPGGSAIFMEGAADGSTDAALIASFSTAWFGTATPPAGVLIGAYGGSGVGLSTSGDEVNIFDANGNRVTGIGFDASVTGFTFDNTAGLGSTTSPLPKVAALSVAGVNRAFVAADGAETGSPGGVDRTAPVVTVPANISVTTIVASGAAVTFDASAVDLVDGVTPTVCAPASGSTFPVGTTTVQCTASDQAGNTGSASFTVTVTLVAPPSTPDGRIYGTGYVNDQGKRHHFAFRVSEVGSRDYGRFEYWVKDGRLWSSDDDDYSQGRFGDQDRDYGRDRRKPISQFEATSLTSVVFSNDPGFKPGRRVAAPRVDSVSFSGTGRWNGKAGYQFTVTATDQGEPGKRRDTFSLVIKDSAGRVVASVEGDIDRGNIQSTRLR